MPKIRISITELVDEILRLPKDKEETFKIWEHILMNGFIFNEFTLIVKGDESLKRIKQYDFKQIYKVKIEGYGEEQKIYVKNIGIDKQGLGHTEKIETTILEFIDELNEVIRDCTKLGLDKLVQWDVNKKSVATMPPMMFMQYAVEKAMHREIIEMPVTTRKYKPMNERKQGKKKEEYKLFEVIRKYSMHLNHNKHYITCERWDVKGHFRHYKNGKIVYVKPYEKGKGKKKEREYKL